MRIWTDMRYKMLLPVPLLLLLSVGTATAGAMQSHLGAALTGPPNHETIPKIPSPLGPTPPRQTVVMQAQMAKVEAAAAVASEQAKPRLLKLLAEPAFVGALNGCCPELVAMTPEQRLDWFDAESAAAEMVHNFGRANGDDPVLAAAIDGDESIELGSASSYFHNLWEIELLAFKQGPTPGLGPPVPPKLNVTCSAFKDAHSCENASRTFQLQIRQQDDICKWRTVSSECVAIPKEQSTAQVTDIVEVGLFGFPGFRRKDASSDGETPHYSFAESINRPIYTAFNHRKVDVGNPMFGHASAIFAPHYVRNMTLIAPVDTGAWDPQCNTSLQSKFNRGGTCKVYTNSSICNDDAPQRITCDWRHGGCVDTKTDRELCKRQTSVHECKEAAGTPYDDSIFSSGKPVTAEVWWNYLLQEHGCSWSSGACRDFRCRSVHTTTSIFVAFVLHCIW
jgi:hypothetical protein